MKEIKLTKFEIKTIIRHLLQDISYGSGGTFYNHEINDDFIVDRKEITIVERAIKKLQILLINKK